MPSSTKDARAFDCEVLIVGAGPVGCTLALDLARRGIRSLVLDQRGRDDPSHPKCNTTSARSMEIFRQVGLSAELRALGLPEDHPCDVVYSTRYFRGEMGRLPIPSWGDRYVNDAAAFDGGWPTPEPPHRISQLYLEPVLRSAMAARSEITLVYEAQAAAIALHEAGATVDYAIGGETRRVKARYVAACDGGRSALRRLLDVKMLGDQELGRARSVCARTR
jgi:2-polyprenyl-6-methoxyphenol hydroxylase-like FAD-dependent oxidoreductase